MFVETYHQEINFFNQCSCSKFFVIYGTAVNERKLPDVSPLHYIKVDTLEIQFD